MSYDKCLDMNEYQKKSCTWKLGDKSIISPHNKIINERKNIYNNVLEFIGNTPLIKLNTVPQQEGVKCTVLAKCEFFNPGGSTKDRIGYRMYQELMSKGRINNKTTLIEATSGNTGIGIALTGAVLGNDVIITLPEKMSQEKCDTLKGLGAKIFRTPTEEPCDSVKSHIGVAIQLQKDIPNSIIPDQYVNEGNALAHYDGTGQEIWDQTNGKVDYVFVSAGTGGTITGIGRKLKELNPNIQIIGIDPHGSLLALPDSLNEKENGISYKVEGIGYDFIPKNCDRTIADEWIKTYDKDSFVYARKLISDEGLLVGGSSGCVLWAAMQYLKKIPEDKVAVLVFVDGIRNYITKFLNDDWMIESGFYDQDEIDKDLNAFGGCTSIKNHINLFKNVNPVKDTDTVSHVLDEFLKQGIKSLPVKNSKDIIIGIILKKTITAHLLNFTLFETDPIRKAVQKEFKKLNENQPMKYLSKAVIRYEYILIEVENNDLKIACSDDLLELFQKKSS